MYRDLKQSLAEISSQSDLNLFEACVIAKALDREVHRQSFGQKAGAQWSLGHQSRAIAGSTFANGNAITKLQWQMFTRRSKFVFACNCKIKDLSKGLDHGRTIWPFCSFCSSTRTDHLTCDRINVTQRACAPT
jgi:hypothetical protein